MKKSATNIVALRKTLPLFGEWLNNLFSGKDIPELDMDKNRLDNFISVGQVEDNKWLLRQAIPLEAGMIVSMTIEFEIHRNDYMRLDMDNQEAT